MTTTSSTNAGLSASTWAITGAAGRIATVLRGGLTDVGELRLFDLAPITDLAAHEHAGELDITALEETTEALRGADGVVHLAAIADEADLFAIAQVNIVGTLTLFEAARRAGVSRVVFASSNHATGMYPVSTLVDPAMPVRPDTYYGMSKVTGEAIGRLYVDKFGLEVACLRIASFAERPRERRHLSTWASYGDTIRAVRAAMLAPALGFAIYYVASANRDLFWDMSAGEAIGFVPLDRAEAYGTDLGGPDYELQGGPHAALDYTLERQLAR